VGANRGRPLAPVQADLLAEIRARVVAHQPTSAQPGPGARRAAVAAVLAQHRGRPVVLMIKRAARGRNPGQYALPGGRLEPGETAAQGALRETEEEIGLPARHLDVLGPLDDFVTDSGFVITPVVAALTSPQSLRRAPEEVAAVLPIPLDRLTDPDLPRWLARDGAPPLLQMPLRRGLVVHAPTGALLWHLREVALLGRAHRLGTVAQPHWTRR
jgi:8-oxo-dGTP pyrophosphatase MutT (NUDIX family)